MLRIHTSVVSAAAILALGEKLVTVKFNETKEQKAGEFAVILPMECLSVSESEVSEQFKVLVESALVSQAESILKQFKKENPNSFELSEELFERQNLVESFVNRGGSWMSKKDLETQFNASKTWARIVAREEFKTNKTYQAIANRFKDSILKLSGKAVQIPADDCDKIISKIHDEDLETGFGQFVVSRLTSLRNKKEDSIDFDSL